MAVLGFDLDGPFYNFGACLWAWWQYKTGDYETEMPPSTCWNFFRDDWGWTLEQYFALGGEAALAGHLFYSQPPHPGSVEAATRLFDAGHTIHIITHREAPGSIANTERWLRKYGVPFHTLTFAGDKTLIPTDFFIEDKVENAMALALTQCKPVIIDRPWNQEWDGARVYSWEDFETYIERHTA